MSEAAVADQSSSVPRTLQPRSLLKRAVVGLLTLVFGIVVGAWLLHSSIQTTDGSRQTAQSSGKVSSAQHAISQRQ